MMETPQTPVTAHQSAVNRIAGWIVAGRFAPGATLPTEDELGTELSVSRTVVREAIKSLAAKGMVAARPRTGTRVRPTSDWHMFDPAVVGWTLRGAIGRDVVADLIEMRLGIEPFAASLAARRRTEADVAALRNAYSRMDAATRAGGEGWVPADLDFHKALLAATRNRFIIQLMPMIEALLTLSFQLSVKDMESAAASLPGHLAVADAVEARDAVAAREALAAIITSAELDILDRFDNPEGKQT